MDIQVLTALALPISIMFFLLGGLIGWVARDYMMNYREIPRPHPEMFDPNGNLVPDEIVAFRFENNYDNDSTKKTTKKDPLELPIKPFAFDITPRIKARSKQRKKY